MLTTDYQIAWGLYLVAALGCFWAWTVFTGWMWRYLREPLWLIAAVLLFTPTQVASGNDGFAPALAVASMDLLFKTNNAAWRALADLSMVGAGACIAYLVFVLLRWLWMRGRPKSKASARERKAEEVRQALSEPTLQEILDSGQDQSDPGSSLVAQR